MLLSPVPALCFWFELWHIFIFYFPPTATVQRGTESVIIFFTKNKDLETPSKLCTVFYYIFF